MKILLPGGAGLVGQNLVAHLIEQGFNDIVVVDKNKNNLNILKRRYPNITCHYSDLAVKSNWDQFFIGVDIVVMLQAQIGGYNEYEFNRNNIISTTNILACMQFYKTPRLIHISSSVINSNVDDLYTNTKKEQENLILKSYPNALILRPTLMYGWFDRKHLGWLARFMKKMPIFPIPGNGEFIRQPLYVRDFCRIILSCIQNHKINGKFNISGHEKIYFIDIIREIRSATKSHSIIIKIPYVIFHLLLWIWGKFDPNPPFTTQQLVALSADDEFQVINWPSIFNVQPTPFKNGIDETFNHPVFSKIDMRF